MHLSNMTIKLTVYFPQISGFFDDKAVYMDSFSIKNWD